MVLNFDGLVGCLGIAKALQIGGSPGSECTQALAYRLALQIGGSPRSECTQALAYRLCDFLLGVSHRWR